MESYEDYQARQKSYSEMLEMAQKMHPDMKVRLDQFTHAEWEFYMPTQFIERYELPEEFKGTVAWEWNEERDSSYDNQLQRYRHKNGFNSVPLEGVAEYVNLNHEENAWGHAVLNKLLEEDGIVIDWNNITKTVFRKYEKHRDEAGRLAGIEFESKRQALKDKFDI